MNEVKKYMALQKINHNKTEVTKGAVIELSDNEATFLLKAKYVRLASEEDGKPTETPSNSPLKKGEDLQSTLKAQLLEADKKLCEAIEESTVKDIQLAESHEKWIEQVATIDTLSVALSDTKALLYPKLTKAELNDELDKRGIEHDTGAKNDELIALLIADDVSQEGWVMTDESVDTKADDNGVTGADADADADADEVKQGNGI